MHNSAPDYHIQHLRPKISIITVTYNAEKVLEDTIQSVITQSYKNVEYIIVDGGSKDGTLGIVAKYRHRIAHLVSEPDKGLYDAMNKGIILATGDYLCFLNAGDELHEDDTLFFLVHSIKSDILPDVIYGETQIVDENGHFIRMRRLSTPKVLTWRSFKKGMLVCHQAFFARRELATSEPFNLKYRFSADFDWCIRILKKSRVIHNCGLTVIDYLNEGMTTRNHKASLMERFHIMCHYYGYTSTIAYHLWFAVRAILYRT